MATMVLPIAFFRCNLQRQIFYPASATAPTTTASTTAKTASTTGAPPPPPPLTTRRKNGSGFSEPDYRSSVADFLVDSLEFSNEEALSTSTELTKWRQSQLIKLRATDFHRKAELVIRFLEQKGFEKPQIRKLVSAMPRILTCKVEANLEPKMNYFLELGFSTSDIADVVSVQKKILIYGLYSTIRPAIEALRTVMGSVENVLRVMKGRCYNKMNVESKCQAFESFGRVQSDVVDLFGHKSYCLTTSQAKIKFVLSFFMNELGRDPGYFVAHPALLCNGLGRGALQRSCVCNFRRITMIELVMLEGLHHLGTVYLCLEIALLLSFLEHGWNEIGMDVTHAEEDMNVGAPSSTHEHNCYTEVLLPLGRSRSGGQLLIGMKAMYKNACTVL
ncbi:hypothetical protein Cgig2_022061 [Carnegiea gigantea]|uniref:Uncharacterized protein n=1 Tax=Carnegiea gigantea TaxID=171969 RepID=A0A9Q1KRV7_9CARY|nr:hypothetical protein Cgig2_022061 [Carnegiea gigantea]